jgi:hypothetical protein
MTGLGFIFLLNLYMHVLDFVNFVLMDDEIFRGLITVLFWVLTPALHAFDDGGLATGRMFSRSASNMFGQSGTAW